MERARDCDVYIERGRENETCRVYIYIRQGKRTSDFVCVPIRQGERTRDCDVCI